MIEFQTKPYEDEEIFKVLNPIVRTWFKSKFKEFAMPQRYAVMNIHKKENTLVSAVTGSGKTLTAFLSILNELINLSEKNELKNQVYAIYVSPLKSLNNDLFFNLDRPLKEMEKLAGKEFGIKVNVRTGDTTASEKQKMLKNSPHILVTTPESLALMLCSFKFKELIKNVQWVIIDELHALADSKRGVHLSLSLERLQFYCEKEVTRIGLSATAEPIEEIAKFLVGDRSCKIVKIDLDKKMDLKVLSPVPDLINTTFEKSHNELYILLDKLIQQHKTTLIFTNTRSATERIVHHLKEKFPEKYTENIGAHHGSLSKEHRLNIEKNLRDGKLKCIVCSTSLELGIDIGYIDLVILLGSPKSVARSAQRLGRSGHGLHETIKGRFIVMDRDDLVECSVLLKDLIERKIDKIHIPTNCLDVLAQQIDGVAVTERIHIDSLFRIIKKSYCYQNLEKKDFMDVIDYLAGKYISLEDRYIYAKIWYDEETGMIGKKGKMGRVIHMTNIGTIPEESFITVKLNEQSIGHIDEGFLEKLKRNDVFVLGGSTYKFLYAKGMVAYVSSASGLKPTIPSWYSEMLPLNFDLACEINRFRKLMKQRFEEKKSKEEIIEFINKHLYVDENAANAIYEYFMEQFLFSRIPDPKEILVEFFNDEDKKYVVFHTLYGRRVNDVLSRALAYAIYRLQHKDVEMGISDNGFYVASDKKIQVLQAFNLIKSNELRKVMEIAIENSEILKRRFRHCATRALMILRNYKGREKRVGRQQVSSMILINALRRISNDFSILKEARREVLEDLMDIDNATKIIEDIENNRVKLKQVANSMPSPFAFNLVLQGYLDVLKMEDRIEFIKRMHSYVLAKINK
ncbi:MAG: ATP-dependent helicase [Candidatus Nanoarchaeia archaeon]|nr:ATP-dependent helicase [Candidatus Nanoarchaeia archaeon]